MSESTINEKRAALKVALKRANKKRHKWQRIWSMIDDQLKELLFLETGQRQSGQRNDQLD